jgi:hypothetical protein
MLLHSHPVHAVVNSGTSLHALSKNEEPEKDGVYPLQALVHSVSLRFKYHFEGNRQTNKLDKVIFHVSRIASLIMILAIRFQPEWYFTHVLNVSHDQRPFMETVIQPLLGSTSFKHIDAWVCITLHPGLTAYLISIALIAGVHVSSFTAPFSQTSTHSASATASSAFVSAYDLSSSCL